MKEQVLKLSVGVVSIVLLACMLFSVSEVTLADPSLNPPEAEETESSSEPVSTQKEVTDEDTPKVSFVGTEALPRYTNEDIVIEPNPPVRGQKTTFFAKVRNDYNESKKVVVKFDVAEIGMGQWYGTIVNVANLEIDAHETVTVSANWIPPTTQHYCVIVRLFMDGELVDEMYKNIHEFKVPPSQGETVESEFNVCNTTDTFMDSTLNIVEGTENHSSCTAWFDRHQRVKLQIGQCVKFTLSIDAPVIDQPGKCVYFVEGIEDDGIKFEVPLGPPPAPAPPTNLVTHYFEGEIRLTWEASISENVSGYYLYRRETGTGEFERISTQLLTELIYVDATIEANVEYEYYVTAVYMDGTEAIESEASVTASPIAAPRNLIVRAGLDAVLLRWEASFTMNTSGYYVYRKALDENEFVKITDQLVTELVYRDTTAVKGTYYEYYVVAVGENNQESQPCESAGASYGQLRLVLPKIGAEPGDLVSIPINIENGDGLLIGAQGIHIEYDSTVATVVGVERAPLSASYGFESNIEEPGVVRISAVTSGDTEELVGPGTLFLVQFQISPNATQNSVLEFLAGLDATTLYTKDDLYTSVPLELVNGLLSLGDLGEDEDIIIDEPVAVRGDLNNDGVVNTADANLALSISVGLIDPTPAQLDVGDVNGDGVINAADSAMIMHYATYTTWPNPDQVEAAVQVLNRAMLSAENVREVRLPATVQGEPGQIVQLPVILSEGLAVASVSFDVQYRDGMSFKQVTLSDTLEKAGFEVEVNDNKDLNQTRISLAGPDRLSQGEVSLAILEFEVQDDATKNIPVEIVGASLSDVSGLDYGNNLPEQVSGSASTVLIGKIDTTPGDCNNDNVVDSGDISCMVNIIFNLPQDIENPGGDANEDGVKDAADIACIVNKIFDLGDCGGGAMLSDGPAPALSIAQNLNANQGETVTVPITYQSNDSEIASIIFSLNYTGLRLDETDNDADGVPDAIQFSVPNGFNATVPKYDTATNTIGFYIADTAPPLNSMTDGTLATIEMEVTGDTAQVEFGDNPPESFGSTSGTSVPGTASGAEISVEADDSGNNGNGNDPVSGVSVYLPMIRN